MAHIPFPGDWDVYTLYRNDQVNEVTGYYYTVVPDPNTAVLGTGEKPAVFRNGGDGKEYIWDLKWAAVLGGTTVVYNNATFTRKAFLPQVSQWTCLVKYMRVKKVHL